MTLPPNQGVSNQVLLALWERCFAAPSAVQALELAALARPELQRETLEHLSIGERDRALLGLRENLFGSQVQSLVHCPKCNEGLEFAFEISQLRIEPKVPGTETPEAGRLETAPLELELAGQRLQFRLPNSLDLIAVSGISNAEQMRQALLERCVLEVEGGSKKRLEPRATWNPESLESIHQAINQAMQQADPQAVIELNLNCPACTHRWAAIFDIASFLWREIDTWARRTLREVHRLARAYGWTEAEILALSGTRRRLYLELVNA
jgi:hypothetical protein